MFIARNPHNFSDVPFLYIHKTKRTLHPQAGREVHSASRVAREAVSIPSVHLPWPPPGASLVLGGGGPSPRAPFRAEERRVSEQILWFRGAKTPRQGEGRSEARRDQMPLERCRGLPCGPPGRIGGKSSPGPPWHLEASLSWCVQRRAKARQLSAGQGRHVGEKRAPGHRSKIRGRGRPWVWGPVCWESGREFAAKE